MAKTAVLIPCYNEAQTIQKVVRDFKEALPHADIYVYDNNSTDGTDKWPGKQGLLCGMSGSREKEMWYAPCFAK